MEYVFWYLFLAIPCFFVAQCNGADLRGRLPPIQGNPNFLEFHRKFFRDGFYLLIHDYFEVHCPWSWETARKHRLNDMRVYLGEDGREHDTLGHITAMDCDSAEKQELIARRAYVTRLSFWRSGFFQFLIPIQGFIVIIGTVIAGIVEFFKYLVGKTA